MISLTSAQINAWLTLLILPLVRILALISSAPVTGNTQFPVMAKIGLAVMLTVIIAPTLPAEGSVNFGSLSSLAPLFRELLLGLAMGLAMRIVFAGIGMAGDIIGLQMGLGFAQFYDPQNSAQVPVLSQFLGLIATLSFLALNGHLMLIATLVESFRAAPNGMTGVAPENWIVLAQWGGMIMQTAVLLSLPLIAALLMTNAALAVLTRAAPQLNVFAVGFPVTLAIGFAALLLGLPYMASAFERLFGDGFEMMLRVARLPVQ